MGEGEDGTRGDNGIVTAAQLGLQHHQPFGGAVWDMQGPGQEDTAMVWVRGML